jgi:hypothetical protein
MGGTMRYSSFLLSFFFSCAFYGVKHLKHFMLPSNTGPNLDRKKFKIRKQVVFFFFFMKKNKSRLVSGFPCNFNLLFRFLISIIRSLRLNLNFILNRILHQQHAIRI